MAYWGSTGSSGDWGGADYWDSRDCLDFADCKDFEGAWGNLKTQLNFQNRCIC